MKKMSRTVILANGSFPKKGSEARRILESAGRIVACNGNVRRVEVETI